MADEVSVEVDGGIAVITINRPQARNAVNEAVARGVAAAIDELDPRPDVAALVLTGAGGTFCAGMDLKGFLAGEPGRRAGAASAASSQRPPAKPIMAAVEGSRWRAASRSRSPVTSIVAAEEARSACRR